MAGPITWKNVTDRTDYGAIADMSRQSQRGFSNAFGQVEGMIEDRNARVTQQNDDAFLNKINNMSVEELQAGQADGSFAAMREGYGDMQSADLLRGAVQNQVTTMQDRGVKQDAYVKGELIKDNQPLTQQISSLLNNGTPEGVAQGRALMESNAPLLAEMGQLDSFSKDALTNQRGNEAYRFDKRARNREEEMYLDGQSSAEALQNIMGSDPASEADAYAQFDDWARENGINPKVANQARANISAQYQATFGMTPEQSEQHSTLVTQEDNRRQSVDLGINQMYDKTMRAINLPTQGSAFELLNYYNNGAPDPVTVLDSLGYDPDTVAEKIPTIRDRFVKTMNTKDTSAGRKPSWSVSDDRLNALLLTASKSEGVADDNFWGIDNTDVSSIVNEMVVQADVLAKLEEKQQNADIAKNKRDISLSDSNQLYTERVNDSKNQHKLTRRFLNNRR